MQQINPHTNSPNSAANLNLRKDLRQKDVSSQSPQRINDRPAPKPTAESIAANQVFSPPVVAGGENEEVAKIVRKGEHIVPVKHENEGNEEPARIGDGSGPRARSCQRCGHWRKNNEFHKESDRSSPMYCFFDGPPFQTNRGKFPTAKYCKFITALPERPGAHTDENGKTYLSYDEWMLKYKCKHYVAPK